MDLKKVQKQVRDEGCIYTETHQIKMQTFVAFLRPFSWCLHSNAEALSLVNTPYL